MTLRVVGARGIPLLKRVQSVSSGGDGSVSTLEGGAHSGKMHSSGSGLNVLLLLVPRCTVSVFDARDVLFTTAESARPYDLQIRHMTDADSVGPSSLTRDDILT